MSNGTATASVLLFILVVFPIFFVAMWTLTTWLMSLLGGWGRVGRAYPAEGRPTQGRVLGGVTGMFGVARYKFVLTVITTETGLYIENRKVFRFGHPPLFIPFAVMHDLRKQTLFFWEYVAFDIDKPALASVRLPSKVFEGVAIEIGR